MKARKILRLKELHIQKHQIVDLENTVQGWLRHPEGYRDLISKSLKDLRRQKVKLMNTFQKYYMSSDWSWLLHKKARETNPKKQFKPVYQESSKMNRLMTTDDEESVESASFYRPFTSTHRGSEIPLDSDRSSKSSPTSTVVTNSRYSRSQVSKPQKKRTVNSQFRVSDDNPFAQNIVKYYHGKHTPH